MRKLKKVLLFLGILFLMVICAQTAVKAESYLYLDNLEFYVKINEDASINITEYWDIEIEETNTLYKTFETDNEKYTGITDVKVTEITDGRNKTFIKQNNWEYHVDSGKYLSTNSCINSFCLYPCSNKIMFGVFKILCASFNILS